MLYNLKNKTAWITGGKRIGQIVADALAKEGVNIIASYKSSSNEADETVRKAKALKVKAMSLQCDVSSRESVVRAVEIISKRFKKIDILINMASVFNPVKFDDITEKDWELDLNTHILGTFWPIQVITKMITRGGHIINIADRTSVGKSYGGFLPYIVSKGAIASMTKALAVELAPKGIFVNAIAPGPILRPRDITKKEWREIRGTSPLKYPISDKEASRQFAILVVYLSSASMVSGYVYPLDQGQNL